jgi:hypothetical protein
LRREQAELGGAQFVEKALRKGGVLASLKGANVRHSLIGGAFDDVGIGLEELDAQQPIMVGRLVLGRNAQPLVVRIE